MSYLCYGMANIAWTKLAKGFWKFRGEMGGPSVCQGRFL